MTCSFKQEMSYLNMSCFNNHEKKLRFGFDEAKP
jgi:hypothetical protein